MNSISKLCDVCLTLIPFVGTSLDLQESRDHHPSIRSVSEAATAGCHLCTFLYDQYFSDFFSNSGPLSSGDEKDRRTVDSISIKWKYSLYDKTKGSDGFIRFFVHGTESDCSLLGYNAHDSFGAFRVVPFQEVPPPTSSKISQETHGRESWEVAFGWIKHCVECHPKCNRFGSHQWMPTRLLDLGSYHEPLLRLHLRSETTPRIPYMTLSHCWGKLQIKKLEVSNLRQMCEKIDIAELPQTFQDAIAFTREARVRFLWIDSLCIIQDSISDWKKESSTMRDVYRNALCNIAATAAPDGRSGCFVEKNPLLSRKCRLQSEKGSTFYDLVSMDLWVHNVEDAPLNKRGWVLQEKMLSPRTLHCGRQQLLWECCEQTACETFPGGISYHKVRHSLFKSQIESAFYHENAGAAETDGAWTIPHAPIDLWHDAIFRYMRCDLTQEQDKLVAISAIAKELQPAIGVEYLAGLWGGPLLPYQLLWKVFEPSYGGERSRRAEIFCAPTWSWASIVASVGTRSIDLKGLNATSIMIQVLECQVVKVTNNPFGQVSGGHLKIRGWLRSLSGFQLSRRKLVIHPEHGIVAWFTPDLQKSYNTDKLSYLPIAEGSLERLDQSRAVMGLVLIQADQDGGIPKQYCRVGLLESKDTTKFCFIKPPPYQRTVHVSTGLAKSKMVRSVAEKMGRVDAGVVRQMMTRIGWYRDTNEDSRSSSSDEVWSETDLTII